jgi:hypothetical protein
MLSIPKCKALLKRDLPQTVGNKTEMSFGSLRIAQSSVVEKIVRRRVAQHSSRLQGMIHPAVLEIIMNKNADQALRDAGYSVPKVHVML